MRIKVGSEGKFSYSLALNTHTDKGNMLAISTSRQANSNDDWAQGRTKSIRQAFSVVAAMKVSQPKLSDIASHRR